MTFVSDDRWTCPGCLRTFTFWTVSPRAREIQRVSVQTQHGRAHAADRESKRKLRRAS